MRQHRLITGVMGRAGLAAIVCLTVHISAANAQSPLELDCMPGRVINLTTNQIGPEWGRYHPQFVLGRLAPIIGRGDYAEATDSVVATALLTLDFVSDTAILHRYRTRLEVLRREFTILLSLPYRAQAQHMANVIQPTFFEPIPSPMRPVYRIFAGTPDEIVVTASMPQAERRALCWPAITIRRLLTVFDAGRRDRTVSTLEALAERWDNYIKNSYSQFPWELALNGRALSRSDYEPPEHQWIVAHPSIGVEANGTVLKELRRVDVAVLEALGLIFFYNHDRTRYLGISGVASFAGNRNVAVGPYGHLWFPQAKLGYLWRSDPDRRRRGSMLVSVDLYDFFDGIPERVREAKAGALGRRILAAR
jgi:hypothetical protein